MIEAHEVRKQFGAVQALGGVSFTARDGQITALLGPNGAGKTTLLRTLVGMLKRDHGSIAIDGVDPEQRPAGGARQHRLPDRPVRAVRAPQHARIPDLLR